MVKRRNLFVAVIAALCMLMSLFAALTGGRLTAYAESPVSNSDGVYSVSIDTSDAGMGASYLTSTGTIEKSGENYYFTFGHENALTNLRIADENGLRTGYTSYAEGGVTYYVYTLSASRLQESLSFTAYIPAMDMDVSFSILLDLANATRTGDYVDVGERPAEYVPVIETSAGAEYEAARGTVFPIPSATATLGSENLDVGISAYYVQGGERTDVAITNNSITLENVGEYHVVYRAESSTYLTNLGNPTYTEYDVKITSSAGGSTLARAEDPNGVLPEGTSILPSRITTGTLYEQAAEKMKSIADNFEVFGVSLVGTDGTQITPDGNITLYLQANMTYDRNEVVVYYMADDGTLTELSADGYGRYVKFDSDKTGTFIVCIPGVAFVMPMWGYAVILIACAFVVAAAIVSPIVIVKKRKKKAKTF